MRSNSLKSWLIAGALSGLAGGVVYGGALWRLRLLPEIAALIGAHSTAAGFVIHMVLAAIIGAALGALIWQQRPGPSETLVWGLTYGALWWFIGPLTLQPILTGQRLSWDLGAAQAAFPSLFGHLLYGGTAGLVLVLLRRDRLSRPSAGALGRGAAGGLVAAWIAGSLLSAQHSLSMLSAQAASASAPASWAAALLIGAGAGVCFALLYPRPRGSGGAFLVRGTIYGFLVWLIVPRTVLPLLGGAALPWSVERTRAAFAPLIGVMLLGGFLALGYHWLSAIGRVLFGDDSEDFGEQEDEEGAGTRGLRAIGGGIVAGIVGGLLFTIIMVQIGFLPTVARLIHAGSATTGFIVHLAISILIGAAYGLLFRRQTYDPASALGWGVSYGFFWWLLGPLTLLPLLLGTAPSWTPEVAGGLMASLVGHIAYGAGLGIGFQRLEARYSPWWVPQEVTMATRAASQREQTLSSAPALWALTAVIALTLPVILGM
ncbi:MAG: hypothetical protein ACR2PL_27275 [Dehalococcoidia bacterium]